MYRNDTSHRFPALLLAACLTTSLLIGLSALAHSRLGSVSPDSRLVGVTSASRWVVSESSVAPLRIDVVAARPRA